MKESAAQSMYCIHVQLNSNAQSVLLIAIWYVRCALKITFSKTVDVVSDKDNTMFVDDTRGDK